MTTVDYCYEKDLISFLAYCNDLYFRHSLPMAKFNFVSFLGLEFDAGNFLSFGGFQNLSFHFCAFHERHAYLYVLFRTYKQDLLKGHLAPLLTFQFFYFDFVSHTNFVLLATSFNYSDTHTFKIR